MQTRCDVRGDANVITFGVVVCVVIVVVVADDLIVDDIMANVDSIVNNDDIVVGVVDTVVVVCAVVAVVLDIVGNKVPIVVDVTVDDGDADVTTPFALHDSVVLNKHAGGTVVKQLLSSSSLRNRLSMRSLRTFRF
jgi:hypothetical protein